MKSSKIPLKSEKSEAKANAVLEVAAGAVAGAEHVLAHRRDFSALLYRAIKVLSMSCVQKTFTKKNVQKTLELFEAIGYGSNGEKYSIQAWGLCAQKVFAAMSRYNDQGVL